ncbi:MAG TPA: hypothetical protein PLR74_12780, partial [Agriterribacter sp.]|nr:hypothetical protein [Agriterribacter sp.]
VEQRTEVKADPAPLQGVVSDDPFSAMLAGVVNDPTIRHQLVIVDKKTLPVNSSNVAEPPVTGAPALPAADADSSRSAEPVAVAVVPEAVKTGIAEAGTKKDETFAVKEITEPVRTDPVTGNAAVPPAAAPKEDSSTLAEVNTPEPFVVKEVVTKRDNAGPPPHTAVNNTATHTEEVKYLPFVIKPGGKADSNNETAQSPEAVTEKKA